jgi:serine/threonine-protein kinase HipA
MVGNERRLWKTDDANRIAEMAVFANLNGAPVLAGTLTFRGKRARQGLFRYDQTWLARDDASALFASGLPLRSRAIQSTPPHEVPLSFFDACPDGWGKAILGMAYPDIHLGAPEWLAASGNDRVGNLQFGPTGAGPSVWVPAQAMLDLPSDEDDLEDLMDAADAFENGVATTSHLAKLLDSGADIGGARPKVRLSQHGESWVLKLRASGDAFDHQCAEAACLSVAREAGIETPEHSVLRVGGRTALMVRRFDRAGAVRFPYTSAATVLGYPPSAYRSESASYADLAIQARRVGIAECTQQLFERMLLNCFLNNTDDHLHNHGFINDGGGWRLSPVFDVVPQTQRALVLRPARGVTAEADPEKAVASHAAFGLSGEEARTIFDRIKTAAATFPSWLRAHELPEKEFDIVTRLAPHAMKAAQAL